VRNLETTRKSVTTGFVMTIENLTRRFGDKTALDALNLRVPTSGVFGIVGENGAGKTTTIKHILGLLKAQSGRVRVFGLDPVKNPKEVLSRIGYLSEEPEFPGWMTVGELMRYTRAFYPGWDEKYARELIAAFRLPLDRKMKNLSKGQRSRAGLVAATAHRPDVLLLDEPSSGLDPIVRRDILNAILRSVAGENRVVVFSSHLLDEVEMVADHVAMISRGRSVLSGTLDEILGNHHVLGIRLPETVDTFPRMDGVLSSREHGTGWSVLAEGSLGELRSRMSGIGAVLESCRKATLDEVFVAHSGVDPLELER